MKKIVVIFVTLFFGTNLMFSQTKDSSNVFEFSPNGDGVKDDFEFASHNLAKMTVTIFDTKGVLVFKSERLITKWDGKNFNGKPVAEGTCFYVQDAVGKDEKTYQQKGKIILKK